MRSDFPNILMNRENRAYFGIHRLLKHLALFSRKTTT